MKEIIHSPEYQTTVYNWNNTDKDYPRDKTIHALFEDQVKKSPESTALVFENTILTYSQLDKRANQLANKIRRDYKVHFGTELSTDVFIAVCLDRSAEMLVSILAVLKSGAAYVPLDPEHPAERIGHIINDTSAQLIITQESYISKFKKHLTPLHIINVEDYELYRDESTQSINIKLTPNNFSYIIYTSGTTGVPKGVVHSHISIVSSLYDNNIFNGCTNFSCKSSYIFAPSVREMFYPLINGHVLHILSNKITQDLNLLINACITFNIEVLYFVPAHLEVFIYAISQCDSNLKQKLNIKYICNCGDKITPAIVQKVIETLPNITLYNQYGFSESSQVSLQHMINSNTVLDSFVPIGKVAQNKKIYILDEYKHPVPIGVTGDLFVAGAGLAVKYVNNEELTNEKFILNPFATPSDILNGYTKMYKTGDLVQWLSDGNVKYIGRSDAQVKIRGFRIELCEVESKLLQISEIKEACVTAKVSQNNNQVYLSAYYVLRNINDSNLSEEYIRVCLSNSIPDYMIPQIFIRLDKMPLNRNGKLDKASLPEPLIKRNSLFIEPTTDTEKICYQIWLDIFNLENISLEDDFFKVGGNSILAIKLSYLLSTKLNKQITIAEIYKYPTIKKFSSYIETTASPSIQIESITLENYPLSFSQERLLFIEQYTGGTNAYHLPLLFEVNQDININLLKQSIILLANRHDVLRTLFKSSENGIYHQVVMNEEIKIQEYSSSSADIYSQIDSDVNRPFNLTTEYPLRICFYYNSKDNKYLLLINRHHIASDGWSRVILLKEITHYYNFLIGKSNDLGLANNSIQYRDYSYWQRHYISGILLENQLNFWKKHLAGYEQFLLPTDKIRPKNIDYSGDTISVKLSHQLSQNLRTLASDNNCSLYVVLLSGFYVLLSKYSNSIDLAVGTPIANRQFNQLAEVIGFFVNTLAVRVRLNISEPIETLLKIVHNTITEAQLFQDLPFDKLVNSIELERSSSQHPIFQVMFNMIGFMNEDTHKEILSKSEYKTNQSAIFDITCEIDDSNQVLIVYFNYATSLYEELTIQRMIKHYQNILEQMVIRDNKPLANYNILSQEEYQTIIYDWNATDKAYPSNKTVHELFIEQAAKTPDNIALVFEDTSLTYEDLDIRSNQLAHKIRRCYLQQTGNELKPDTLIALCLDRSLEMVIGILGTLKAGAAYVPLDSEFPDNRLNYIFNDIDSKLVITQSQHMAKLANLLPIEKEVLLLDISSYSSYEDEQKDTPRTETAAEDLAYVIYTSGTTGKPKGVMVEHYGLINRLYDMQLYSNINSRDVYCFKTSYVFDVSFSDIFTHLISGAKIICTRDKFDLLELSKIMVKNTLTSIHLVTSQYSLLAEFINMSSIKKIYFSGEALTKSVINGVEKWIDIYNYYGPTETGEITFNKVSKDNKLTIGKAFHNTKVYVLDINLCPVPIGTIGELYIAGVGLARGYLNNPELTAERFIPNPFATKEDIAKDYTRMYKTGDLVRWLSDGNLEYIGRNDFQVKIRGFRIELGEIEEQLRNIKGIQQVVVVAKKHEENNNQYLVAYYVLDQSSDVCSSSLTKDLILDRLSLVLPDYMIPSKLMELDNLPLTINGKLDRNALPEPEITIYGEKEYVGPQNPIQSQLQQIYAQILQLTPEEVSIDGDFFKLGGNSLLAIKLLNQINTGLDLQLNAFDIFNKRTIRALASNSFTGLIEHTYYYTPLIKSNPPDNSPIMVFVPGYHEAFERNYTELINLYSSNSSAFIYLLKNNFAAYPNFDKLADYYCQIVKELVDKNKEIVLLGFSAGGVVAYLMCANLTKHYNVKLVLFDTFFPRKNYYQMTKNFVRKLFNLELFNRNWHDSIQTGEIKHINIPILFFKATQRQDPRDKRYILADGVRLRWLRQLKSDIEFLIYKCQVRNKGILFQNNLRGFMQIYEVVEIDADHNGVNGILTLKFLPLIENKIKSFMGFL